MAARLTDEQKKRIIADYVESGSYRATARKNGVSDKTVRDICKNEAQTTRKAAQKKAENTLDMLEYMDSRKGQAQGIIDTYLEALADPEKLENASLQQIATALGIVIDKFISNPSKHQIDKQRIDIDLQRFELEKRRSESGKEESNELLERLIDAVKRVE